MFPPSNTDKMLILCVGWLHQPVKSQWTVYQLQEKHDWLIFAHTYTHTQAQRDRLKQMMYSGKGTNLPLRQFMIVLSRRVVVKPAQFSLSISWFWLYFQAYFLFCLSVTSQHWLPSGQVGRTQPQHWEERQQEMETGETALFEKLLQWVSLVGDQADQAITLLLWSHNNILIIRRQSQQYKLDTNLSWRMKSLCLVRKFWHDGLKISQSSQHGTFLYF